MSDLDQREDALNIVYSVIVDCATDNIGIWELIPVIRRAILDAYPDVQFRIVLEV